MTESFFNSIDRKSSALKQKILALFVNESDLSITELSKRLEISIPTTTKLVGELIDNGFLEDIGKAGTSGGRKPSIYGLKSSAGFIIGVDVRRNHVSIAVSDFKGIVIDYRDDIPFTLKGDTESVSGLCSLLKKHLTSLGISPDSVLAYGINLSGRVNRETGYSFSYFIGEDKPIGNLMEEILGTRVFIENDSRAMAYGEYICGETGKGQNIIFINVSWGLGMGMVIDGKLSYGKSGFSGEIGHFPMLNNGIICHCGKVGCLETGASGSALYRIVMEKLQNGEASILSKKFAKGEEITLDEILNALKEEDILAIEAVEEVGSVLGRTIAGLINLFNPEMVVIGGWLSVAEEYLMLPLKAAINKHSLNIVNKDSTIKFSKLGRKAGPVGACMLSRSKLLGLI